MRREVSSGVPDAADPLPGVDLLDEPSRILPPELGGVDAPVAEDVEVRRELPLVLLLAPGVEDGDAGCGTECDHRIIDMFADVVELGLGLAEPLDEVLRWGHHPMADVSDGDALLLAENLV